MIFFNAVCDIAGCKSIQPIYFEKDSETFGEVVDFLKAHGWRVISGTCQKDMILVCSKHLGEFSIATTVVKAP